MDLGRLLGGLFVNFSLPALSGVTDGGSATDSIEGGACTQTPCGDSLCGCVSAGGPCSTGGCTSEVGGDGVFMCLDAPCTQLSGV